MEKVLFLLLLAGLVIAKPADDDGLIENLVNQPEAKDDKEEPQYLLPLMKDEDSGGGFSSLISKFIHYLLKVSIRNVKPNEHPDRKYIKPGQKLIRKLLVVRRAVIGTFEPIIEIGNLMVQDYKEMMRRLIRAARQQNMFKAKHIVGEYFIALNRRFVSFVLLANKMGLFKGIGKNRSEDAMHLHRVKRELEDQVGKAKRAIKFILENFSELRVTDGLLDEPFVKLGVETVKVFIKAFHQSVKVGKAVVHFYTDMITDIVRLALVEKKHEAAIQRAGAGILSGIRRDCKTIVAIHHWYVQRKCYGPEEDEALLMK